GHIWCSTNGGFGYIAGNRCVPIRGVPAGFVFSIVEDVAGDLWIMNYHRGVVRLRDESVAEFAWVVLGRSDYGRHAASEPQHGIWLGFEQGGVAHFSDGRIDAVYSEG